MRPRSAVLLLPLLLVGCTPHPAELVVSAVEPATATAQYFHGNCFAGFSVGVDLRVQETRRVRVVLSTLSYRLTDRGTGDLVSGETLDAPAIEARYGSGAASIPADATKLFRLGGVSARAVGPLAVDGELRGVDENDRMVVEAFELFPALTVNDPGSPEHGACSSP